MGFQPEWWLERFTTALIPPGSREHVLGDLAECSETRGEYLENLASALPCVIVCHIRRRVSKGTVVINAIASAIALTAATTPPVSDSGTWIRLLLPWAIWNAGCVLAAAYGPPDKLGRLNPSVLGATFLVVVIAAVLAGFSIAAVATGLGALIVLLLLLNMPWVPTEKLLQPLSVDTLPDQARAFQRTIWWRNAREIGAALIVLTANVPDMWRGETAVDRLSHGLLVAGTLFVMGYLRFRAGSRPLPAGGDSRCLLQFHRDELVRQRDILRDVPRWYLLPFIPGLLVGMLSKLSSASANPVAVVLALPIVLGVFYLIWRVNVWAAAWLDKQVQQAIALEERMP
ncbi:MAG TPA: hypothetical protein VH702_19080 [Vicinamibacterales bacterium]